MPKTDPRVDAYIAKSADFARPILIRAREVVHEACPDVEETLKWGMPSFMYEGLLCGMAAFKKHAALGFWKSPLILDAKGNRADEAMGSFGRLTKVSDLPPKKVLIGYIRKAMELNEQKVSVPRKPAAKKPPVRIPADLGAALAKNKKAREAFAGFSPSHRRDYVEWITEAKTDATRGRRVATTIEWAAKGRSRNWKYERK